MTSCTDKKTDSVRQSLEGLQLNAEKDTTQKANKDDRPATLLSLSAKVLRKIARILRQDSLGSLANLNVCSKALYAISLPILWKEVVWKANMWKDAQDRSDGNPAGWQFVEYIHFSGKAPWFWKGLVDALPAEEAKSSSQDIVQLRWPKLQMVIRTESLINVEVPKSVWLTLQGATDKQSTTESAVGRVIEMAYKAWKIANLSPAIIPKFVSHYQPIEDSFKHSIISYKPQAKKRPVIPNAQNRPPTTLQHFQLDYPDATLEVDMILAKCTLDFYLISDIVKEVDQASRLCRVIAIWKLFKQTQRHFAPAKLVFALERCWIFDDVQTWLDMAEVATVDEPARNPSFEIEAILGVPHTAKGFLSEAFRLQDHLIAQSQKYGFDADGATKNRSLPVHIELTDMGHPSLPPPVCVHAKIKMPKRSE
ncbi:hypothetical protein QFC22_004809 [Naganishia vaughanmartiniae]|uniref:Uncharacterized protein n=1 Tax=Naganishia vaughanmartiniae TaxID=1424756 RepID=A0ACC2WY06_9TREE|nr:hypothetical protein QFC22_004809 [Naganishia vaughanmartiniae]